MTHHNVVGRRLDPLTGKIYHLLHRPPTGVDEMEIRQRLVQRADDTRKRIATRLAAYHAHLSGVLVVYQKVRMDLRLGDGGGKTILYPTTLPAIEDPDSACKGLAYQRTRHGTVSLASQHPTISAVHADVIAFQFSDVTVCLFVTGLAGKVAWGGTATGYLVFSSKQNEGIARV